MAATISQQKLLCSFIQRPRKDAHNENNSSKFTNPISNVLMKKPHLSIVYEKRVFEDGRKTPLNKDEFISYENNDDKLRCRTSLYANDASTTVPRKCVRTNEDLQEPIAVAIAKESQPFNVVYCELDVSDKKVRFIAGYRVESKSDLTTYQ